MNQKRIFKTKRTGSIVDKNDNMTLRSVLLLRHVFINFELIVIMLMLIFGGSSAIYMNKVGWSLNNFYAGLSNFMSFLF